MTGKVAATTFETYRSVALVPHTAPIGEGMMLPAVPTRLPASTP
ncbi:hypothetical protein ABZY36_37965 [Streptomyces sp. NPDC006627]